MDGESRLRLGQDVQGWCPSGAGLRSAGMSSQGTGEEVSVFPTERIFPVDSMDKPERGKSGDICGLAAILFVSVAMLLGCAGEDAHPTLAISGFTDHLKDQGADGTLQLDTPSNEDIEYVANYVISKFTSTRIVSFFKFTSVERAEFNLKEAMKNPKMSGQARNGTIIMAATFYPPDDEAVNKIKELFLNYDFEK